MTTLLEPGSGERSSPRLGEPSDLAPTEVLDGPPVTVSVAIDADDSCVTHWPCGYVLPVLFRPGVAWRCPRCGRLV